MKNWIKVLLLIVGFAGASAQAQDFGIIAGVHESDATAKGSGVSTDGVFGFRLGGVASLPIADKVNFRTGLMYTQRHFDIKADAIDLKVTAKEDYLDIPVLFQGNITEQFGIFGGLIVGININNDAKLSDSNGNSASGELRDVKSLLPLVQVGVNGTFNNEFGVEAYYERGLGDLADGYKDYSVFGANFIYWL